MNNKVYKKMEKTIKCQKCNSKEVNKDGVRKTQNRGNIQRFRCKSCKNRFVTDVFKGMRNNPKKITCALDLFYRGLSTRGVQEHFKAFYPHNSDHSTILRWIRKYSLQIADFTDNLKINCGSYIEVDEMEYHRRKSHKFRGVDKNWLINGIDVKTRFLINSTYAKHRNKKEIVSALKVMKHKTEDRVKIVTTDGLFVYRKALNKSFGLNKNKGSSKITHKVVNASKGEGFNIWVERIHNSIRQRTHSFRGLHGSVSSAYAIMKGLEIYYNFVKKHEALDYKTPSELAIPDLKLENSNRWLELIERSAK